MHRTTGRFSHRARSSFIVLTLVTSTILGFTPFVPAATVTAAVDPSIAPDPTPTAAPDPTPDPTPAPTPDPTPDPTPAPTPDPTPDPASPTPTADPGPAPAPDPSAPPAPEPSSPAPDPSQDPTPPASLEPTTSPPADPIASPDGSTGPDPSTIPSVSPDPSAAPSATPEPAPSPTPIPDPAGPHALRFHAAEHGAAVSDAAGGFGLRTFTIETWFMRRGPSSGAALDVAVATGRGGLDAAIPLVARGSSDPGLPTDERPAPEDRINWFLGIDAGSSVLVADFQDRSGRNHPIVGRTRLADDAWHHAAATFDGVAWRLYLDGRLEAEVLASSVEPDPSGLAPVSLATSVAADRTTARGFLDGALDETHIWSVARRPSDIRDDMRRPIEPDDRDLVAAWALDQDRGAIAPDRVRPGAPLSLLGRTTWVASPVPDATIPPAPVRLIAVGTSDGVSLAWTGVDADDLAGYMVYRSDDVDPASTSRPLTGWQPVRGESYLDRSAVAGVVHRYVVTAVDQYGNESAASPEASGTRVVRPDAPPSVDVEIELSASVPDVGRRRIDPGMSMTIDIAARIAKGMPGGRLVLGIPADWSVTDADGGALDPGGTQLTWDVVGLAADSQASHRVGLLAPLPSPAEGEAHADSAFTSAFEQPAGVTAGPSMTILVAPAVAIEHDVLAQVDDLTLDPAYLAVDEPIADQQRFEVFRVRFQLENLDDVPVVITPQLESRDPSDAGGAFAPVPAPENQPGVPFYVAREWTPLDGRSGGTELGDEGAAIRGEALIVGIAVADGLTPVQGYRAMGRNPAPALALPARSVTEVEFSVRATVDAAYLAEFDFRISDAGVPIPDAVTATVQMGLEPPLLLSPGQRSGVTVGDPSPATPATVAAYPLDPTAGAATVERPRYGLLAAARTAQGGSTVLSAPGGRAVHGSYTGSTDACALCHGSHSAQGRNLVTRSGPQSGLCFTCHDSAGTGANTRVQAQYLDPAAPPNDPATGSIFRHDALATNSDHSQSQIDEFGGQSDRHDECGDCHDPHSATSTDSTQTVGGWMVSGRSAGTSGVAVVNGAAGSAPTYTFLDGATEVISLEYQLCFKCHSGFTTLPAKAPAHPSRWALDKGTELNPDNQSYHPVEAPGRNLTSAMSTSLAGTSPYKLWNFTTGSTVRCVNCHGDPSKATPASAPAAGSDLAPHAVTTVVAADGTQLNRGLLLQPYRDRVLKGPADAYTAVDSALCLVCHKQAPFTDVSGNQRTDTNFRYHGKHVASLRNKGAVLGDIDTPGAGRGNAICSECHYRIHSTASRNDFRTSPLQSGTDGGLLIFAPNVTPSIVTGTNYTGEVEWTRTATSSGTCALNCHGKDHDGKSY